MADWDDIIVTGFLYQNCNMFRSGIHNIKELVARVLVLLHRTLLWGRSKAREIRTRTRIAAAAVAAAAAAAAAVAVPPQNELQMEYQGPLIGLPSGIETEIDIDL